MSWGKTCSVYQFSSSVVFDSATPPIAAHQASLSNTNSRSLLKLIFIESVMPFNHLILCCPLLLLPSVFPSIRVFFPNDSVLLIINTSKYHSILRIKVLKLQFHHQTLQWIFRVDFLYDWLVWSCSPRDFSSTTVWKHQFFGAQPSLWSDTHIHAWLLEKT